MFATAARNVTFLFTDIEGSTRLWETAPEAMSEALARHDDVLHRCIEQGGGSVFKTVGDAFCAVFPDAKAALGAALEAQIELTSASFDQIGSLRVRMAIHSGPALQRGDDYFGPTLNRVARLLSAGHGGQVLVSLAAAEAVGDNVPAGATLTELGEYRLKDLAEPERIFRLAHPGLSSDDAPLRSLEALHHNLPLQLTSFVGRQAELAEVIRLLSTTRLLTLTGAGGSGKSRLALEAAGTLVDDYPHGVWLLELAPLSDAGLVPQTVGSVLGMREQPGRPWTEALCDHLVQKQVLLILDNCEHVLDESARLTHAILRQCPAVKVLTTSREGLGIEGETTYRVPSLSLPDQGDRDAGTEPEELMVRSEAVRLFVERAAQAHPGFRLTADDVEAVVHICRRLDGIPLAIELAASRTKLLSVDQIVSRLDDRFRLLTGGSRSALPRQQTLQALIDWSYDLLSEEERALLRTLSVFAGGWTLEAAEAVCPDGQIPDGEVLDLMLRLIDKSLVVAEEGPPSRYRLLETVRQYARDRLLRTDQVNAVRDRHLDLFLRLAKEAEPKLRTGGREEWLQRLDSEQDNVRAALEWSLSGSGGPDRALHLAIALGWYWFFRSLYTEGRRWLDGALGSAESSPPSVEKSEALFFAGILAWDQGDLNTARSRLEDSAKVARRVGDPLRIGYALSWLSVVSSTQGDVARARSQLEESVAILRKEQDPWALGLALMMLAQLSLRDTGLDAALPLADESLDLFGAIGDPWGMGTILSVRGLIAFHQGDLLTAGVLIDEALEMHRDVGHKFLVMAGLSWSAKVALRQQHLSRAREILGECLQISLEMQSNQAIGESLAGLATVEAASENPRRVAMLLGAAEESFERAGSSLTVLADPDVDEAMAEARVTLGDEQFERAWSEGKAMSPEAFAESDST